ncbi:MAG TPA: hypothetical protein VFK05_31495, partial [Polyangiaceae bacterium]|nr:hypothetical protein [Polyangiaceae bacterium]
LKRALQRTKSDAEDPRVAPACGTLDATVVSMTTLLDRLIPAPRLLEVDRIDLAAPPERAWDLLRHADLARTALIRALFELRAVPERLAGRYQERTLRIDDLRSSPAEPGFSLLLEDTGREFAVGAIGKVWQPVIPFVHVVDAAAFSAFSDADQIKVAWSVRALPLGDRGCRVEVEVRVDATDDAAWHKFERYFRLIGPGSRFIRRALLSGLSKELGTLEAAEAQRPLPGDEWLPLADAEVTDGITLSATPEQVWPWLVQMGCRRAGFYSVDLLDNAGLRSSREIVPELQQLSVGDVIPATPEGKDGFEVLRIDACRNLVLGGLFDVAEGKQLPFVAPRPERYWQVTWAFVLEPLAERSTRLHVRARAAFAKTEQLHALWIRPVHHFMQHEMLEHLAARVEGRLPQNDLQDVLQGVGGAALMLAALLTPFLRRSRNHWGVEPGEAAAPRPGDELVVEPLWSWTHGIEVRASPELVWQWIAQIGADRGAFYSYQWLENLLGCSLKNADALHPEWQLALGDSLLLHPQAPPLRIALLEPNRYFVAHAPFDEVAHAAGRPWAAASWLLQIEPLAAGSCRLITRFRVACSADVATRLRLGPTLLEPIGFAMDRRMLLGIKARAERQADYALATKRSAHSEMVHG